MARRASRKHNAVAECLELEIESIDLEGQGVAHHMGKVFFVHGAITGERVLAQVVRSKPSYAKAQTIRVLRKSWQRVNPPCPHYEVCGGCSMQHIEPSAQVAIKNRALEDLLHRVGGLKDWQVLAPIYGLNEGYRQKARLGVRFVEKKGKMLLGFHERNSSFIAEMDSCKVLAPHVSALLNPLKAMLTDLTVMRSVPQIELACGAQGVTVLVLRNLAPLAPADFEVLHQFETQHEVQIWLQPEGPSTAEPWLNFAEAKHNNTNGHEAIHENGALAYAIEPFSIRMQFRPTDFTQVNHRMNESLVQKALNLLDIQPSDAVLDLFCGLGNFTLPMATKAQFVMGIEGSETLCERAEHNAKANGLAHKAHFAVQNLFDLTAKGWQQWFLEAQSAGLLQQCAFDKALIDPPRDGALEVCKGLQVLPKALLPKRIVYVSCNPATLARDAAVLCHNQQYRLSQAGVVNMFPHTAHVESIAVFERLP